MSQKAIGLAYVAVSSLLFFILAAGCDCGGASGGSCTDKKKNSTETDVDCGGSCRGCPAGRHCLVAKDCLSAICTGDICQEAAGCQDGKQDGDETDKDCGGSCSGCATGLHCLVAQDCLSSVCTGGICRAAAGCGNGNKDPGEECDNGTANSDTQPDACRTNCKLPWCGDHVVDTGEQCDDGGPSASCDTNCHHLAQEGENCSAIIHCAPGLVCAAGVCVASAGSCISDQDCSGDTYCCTGNCLTDPLASPACIAYGTGDRGAYDPICLGHVVLDFIRPVVRCQWAGPPTGDPFPDHKYVLATPLVMDLPYDSGAGVPEILIVTYNNTDGGVNASRGDDPQYFGVMRVLNASTCAQLDSISDPANPIVATVNPAIADLDGDSIPEIVTYRAGSDSVANQPIAFKWNPSVSTYQTWWVSTGSTIKSERWDGPAIHDIDNDGFPEILASNEVFDHLGQLQNPDNTAMAPNFGFVGVVGDLDGDGQVELISKDIFSWDTTAKEWTEKFPRRPNDYYSSEYAFADFGTEGAIPADFKANVPDGIAEVVFAGKNTTVYFLGLATLDGQVLFNVTSSDSGFGAPTVADFDGDGHPEIASIDTHTLRVYDLDCANGPATPGCVDPYVRWKADIQDYSSGSVGLTAADLDGNGRQELILAEECYTRVFDGLTGRVLSSMAHASCTFRDQPIVAELDSTPHSNILVENNPNCGISCPTPDPIDPGLACSDGSQCGSGTCDQGLCRCSANTDCDWKTVCAAPLAGTPGSGNVCRAGHDPSASLPGLQVLWDAQNRWAGSRPLWNQYSYTVTNIGDHGAVPKTSAWVQNFETAGLNDFRVNTQGTTDTFPAPDLTGRFENAGPCRTSGGNTALVAMVCNRGSVDTSPTVAATFYLGDPSAGNILCTAATGAIAKGNCAEVSCTVSSPVTGTITLVTNDNGTGSGALAECDARNNRDSVAVVNCQPG